MVQDFTLGGTPPVALPVIKWIGGKRQLLPLLHTLLPDGWSGYHEPFIGGGALFFDLWTRNNPSQSVSGACLNDFNQRLINMYQGLTLDCCSVVWELEKLAKDCSKAGYDRAVVEFNRHRPIDPATSLFVPDQLPLPRQAALLIFISRLCFNGLFRENRFGAFNVGYCHEPTQFSLRANELQASALALLGASLSHGDFERAMLRAEPGGFIFLDPPYDATFSQYVKGSFGPKDQARLAKACGVLDRRGVKFMMTNSDTPRVRELWAGYEIISSEETRSVNSDGEDRGPVGCVIVRNYSTGTQRSEHAAND